MDNQEVKYNYLLFITLLVGTFLRFYNISDWSFSNDELSALSRTNFDSFGEIIKNAVAVDGHPAATQLLIHYWSKLFGNTEIILRLPFAIFSVISILLTYLVGKNLFNKKVGLLSAVAMATFFFPVIYGPLARPYSIGLMSCLGMIYGFSFFLRNETTVWQNILFILFAALCLYTHYFAALLFGLVAILGFVIINKNQYKRYIVSLGISAVLFIPGLPVFFAQISKKGLNWLSKPDLDFITEHLLLINNNSWLIILAIIVFIIIGLKQKEGNVLSNKNLIFVAGILVLHFLIGYLYSIYRQPVLQSSTLLFSFPFYLFAIFYLFPSKPIQVYSAVGIILLLGTLTSISTNKLFATNHFGVFKELAEQTVKWNDTYGAENITHINHINNAWYLDFYYEKQNKHLERTLTKIESKDDFVTLYNIVKNSSTPYFCFSRSSIATNPQIYDIVMDKYATVEDVKTYFNAQTILLKRSKESRKLLKKYNYDGEKSESPYWNIKQDQQDTSYSFEGLKAEKLDSTHLYSSTFEINLDQLNLPIDSVYIGVELMGFTLNDFEATVVIQFTRDDEQIDWYGIDIEDYMYEPNKWTKVFCSRIIPKKCVGSDKVKIYIWNRGKKNFYFDNLEINIYSRNQILF